MNYQSAEKDALCARKSSLEQEYNAYKEKKLTLGMTRGVPCRQQLDLSDEVLSNLTNADFTPASEYRNYGLMDGIPQAKALFSQMIGVSEKEIMVLGNSSLNLMYDTLARAMIYGVVGSEKPWCKYEKVKFLCPVPGYDRHFSVCQSLGIEMINVPMTAAGPDMDEVQQLVENDDTVKGIWCTPKYSNPQGITYSDDTVRRFAGLKPAARDFRIMWDNAYIVHDLTEKGDVLLNILDECKKAGNANSVYIFASTSKITYPGSGVAMIGASEENIAQIQKIMSMQTIGHDKINQLRHVKFLKSVDNIYDHMQKHAKILKPKFDTVEQTLTEKLGGMGIASWTTPNGGYFVSLDVPNGCAKRTIALAKDAGVALTPAGSTYPYMNDPSDANIRIAPTFPSVADLRMAMEILCICVELAYCELLLAK